MKPSWNRIYILTPLLFVVASQLALAAPPISNAFDRFETALSCLTVSLANQLGTWPRIAKSGPFYKLWSDEASFMNQIKPFQNGLFLADGTDVDIARMVARQFPEKHITATDIWVWGEPIYMERVRTELHMTREEHRDRHPEFYKEKEELKNLSVAEVDITKPFPYADNQFELVFLAKGLCRCHGSANCCAGIKFEREEMAHPIRETIRVLDKNKPGATAFLHGALISIADVAVWQSVLASMPETRGLVVEWVRVEGEFRAIRIRVPKKR